ncbi:hypothetical protein DY000_02061216 [Brassica cretica]|uniref:Uncharacterized protein n=1 Tax=Brassica cretica TaxID=69181 RepID=A0ABQ7ANH7_BRACR|nr:hypothetical protein DY000_02061216 [Brassica cretica]
MDTTQDGVLVYQLDQTEVFMSDHASPNARVIPSDYSVHADHNFPLDRADQTVRPAPYREETTWFRRTWTFLGVVISKQTPLSVGLVSHIKQRFKFASLLDRQGSSECIRGTVHFLIVTGELGRGLYGIKRKRDGIPESLDPPVDRGNERLSMGMLDQTEVFMSDHASPNARVIPSDYSVHADHNFPLDRADQTVRPAPYREETTWFRRTWTFLGVVISKQTPLSVGLVSHIKQRFKFASLLDRSPLGVHIFSKSGRVILLRRIKMVSEPLWLVMMFGLQRKSNKEKSPRQTVSQSPFKYSLNNFDEFVSVQERLDIRCKDHIKTTRDVSDPKRRLLKIDVQEICDNFEKGMMKALKDISKSHKKSTSTCAPVAEQSLFISEKPKDVEKDRHFLKMSNIVACLDIILVCNVYFDVHLERLKCVLLVLGKEILIFELNKYLSCTFNPGLLVFVLSIQERQVQPLRNESIDRAQQPEIWRSFVVQTGYVGDASDRGSVQNGYLNIQKVFCHDFNFPGNPTHKGFTEAWNHLKIFTEEGVMNFPNWRFSIPSIREYKPSKGDSGPRKKRPEPKPILHEQKDKHDHFPRRSSNDGRQRTWNYLMKMTSKLQGSFSSNLPFNEFYLFLKFFLSDSFSFDSGKMDLRTNPFEEGEYDTLWIEHRHIWFMDTTQDGVLVYQLDQTEVFMSDHASPNARVIPSDYSVHADHNFPLDRADQTVRPAPYREETTWFRRTWTSKQTPLSVGLVSHIKQRFKFVSLLDRRIISSSKTYSSACVFQRLPTEPRHPLTELEPSSVATQRPSSSQTRSLRSDRARIPIGRYVATELEPSSVAT